MTARKGKPEQPKWDKQTGQEDDGMHNRNAMTTARTGLPVHDCQYRTARTGLQCRSAKIELLGHDFRDRRARADFTMLKH
jgi:hypothetical protein